MVQRLLALLACLCFGLVILLVPAVSSAQLGVLDGADTDGDDEEAPPAEDEEAPPAEDEEAPPAEDEEAPPAEDDEAPAEGEAATEEGDATDTETGLEGEDAADTTEGGDEAETGEVVDEAGEGGEPIEELDDEELLGFDGEPVDPELAAMLAEDFDGPLTDEQEDAVLAGWDDVEGVEFDDELRAEFEGLDPEQFQALAEVSPEELAAADELTPAFTEQLEAQAEATAGLSPEAIDALTKLFIDALRKKLATVRGEVLARTIESVRAKQAEKLGNIMMILVALSPLGLLLLFMPLVLKNKYPNQMPTLVRASGLAAVAFVGAMLMFTGLMFMLRIVQNEAAMATNPQIRVVEASFDAVDNNLDEIAAMPGLLEVPLQQLRDGDVDSLEVALLHNVKSFKEDLTVFDRVAKMFQSINWLFGWVAIAMMLLTVVLFLVAMRPLLTEIVQLPARAAKGEVAPSEVIGLVSKRVGNELLVTLCVAGLATLVAVVSGFIEARLVGPAMDAFILQLLVAMQYVFVEPLASTSYVYVAMGSVMAFLVLNIAVVVVSGGLFIRMAQKILKARFHEGVPLADHKQFWLWGSVGLLWALVLPYLVLRVVLPFSQWLVDSGTTGDFSWGRVLVAGPLTLAIGFLILFVLGQGLRGMIFSLKYKLTKDPVAEPAAA
jgi:hypothetical protein